ncbi:Uncharacterised protein [Neisseria meningitidis]|nr:Uncharacterised protein [Neisseria meningitidis]
MFDGCGQAARRAVNVNVGHGAVAFVEHVFKVQTDACGFSDFVMRGQIQRGVGALGQCGCGGSEETAILAGIPKPNTATASAISSV